MKSKLSIVFTLFLVSWFQMNYAMEGRSFAYKPRVDLWTNSKPAEAPKYDTSSSQQVPEVIKNAAQQKQYAAIDSAMSEPVNYSSPYSRYFGDIQFKPSPYSGTLMRGLNQPVIPVRQNMNDIEEIDMLPDVSEPQSAVSVMPESNQVAAISMRRAPELSQQTTQVFTMLPQEAAVQQVVTGDTQAGLQVGEPQESQQERKTQAATALSNLFGGARPGLPVRAVTKSRTSPVQSVVEPGVAKNQEPIVLTQEQVVDTTIAAAIKNAVDKRDRRNPMYDEITGPEKAQKAVQKELEKYFTQEAQAQFEKERLSLIEQYQIEDAITLEEIKNNEGESAVGDRINRKMAEILQERIDNLIAEHQKEIDVAGKLAKDQVATQLKDLQTSEKSQRKVKDTSSKADESKVRNAAVQKELQKLENTAHAEFIKNKILLSKVKERFKDQYYKAKKQLPDVKEVEQSIEDYFKSHVMRQVKKDNQQYLQQVGDDAVRGGSPRTVVNVR